MSHPLADFEVEPPFAAGATVDLPGATKWTTRDGKNFLDLAPGAEVIVRNAATGRELAHVLAPFTDWPAARASYDNAVAEAMEIPRPFSLSDLPLLNADHPYWNDKPRICRAENP